MERVLLIALGGAIGTVFRYLTSGLAATWLGVDFPYGTLIVNLVGSFLIGLIQQIGTQSLLLSDEMRLFLTTGVMGRTHHVFGVQLRDRPPAGGPRLD